MNLDPERYRDEEPVLAELLDLLHQVIEPMYRGPDDTGRPADVPKSVWRWRGMDTAPE